MDKENKTEQRFHDYGVGAKDGNPRAICTFGMALQAMKCGKGARRKVFIGDTVLRAQFPDEHSKMSHPYIYAESIVGRVPYALQHAEIFAEDWEIVD